MIRLLPDIHFDNKEHTYFVLYNLQSYAYSGKKQLTVNAKTVDEVLEQIRIKEYGAEVLEFICIMRTD